MSMTVEIAEPVDMVERLIGLTIKYNSAGEHLPLLAELDTNYTEDTSSTPRVYDPKTHTFTLSFTTGMPKHYVLGLLLSAKQKGIDFEFGHDFNFSLEETLWVS